VPTFHGDESLLQIEPELMEKVRSLGDLASPSAMTIALQAAICFDMYGLPDGTVNGTHWGKIHATLVPPEPAIHAAFDGLLSSMLPSDLRWLLQIPRRIAPLHSIDAHAYVSSQGGAAIVLPLGALGGIFLMNEVFHASYKEIGIPPSLHAGISAHLPALLAEWLLCREPEDASLDDLRSELLLFLQVRRMRCQAHVTERFFIWSTTVVQQLFLLLHEFGHLVTSRCAYSPGPASGPRQLAFTGADDELRADAWALSFLREGLPGIAEKQYVQQALFLLFGAMYLLSRGDQLGTIDGDICKQRLTQATQVMEPMPWERAYAATELLMERYEDVFLGRTGRFQDIVGVVRKAYWRCTPEDDTVSAETVDLAVAWNDRGCDRMQEKKLAEAIRCFEKAIELYPGYPEAHCNLGNCYDDLGQPDRALELYDEALNCDPDPVTAANILNEMAVFHRKAGDGRASFFLEKAMAKLREWIR
jgi:hypothetical protein